MRNKDCLNEQDLILHYYDELPASSVQARHVSECSLCTERLTALSDDLSLLPKLTYEHQDVAGTRMAARVNEQLSRRLNWLPALGATTVATLTLVITVALWTPQAVVERPIQPITSSPTVLSLNEEMPEIDFLEDLELLQELEMLSQLEGV